MSAELSLGVYEQLIEYVRTNQSKFYRIAYTHVTDEQLALDIVQESIYKALTKYKTLKQPEYMQTWFYRILINQCISAIRRQRFMHPLSTVANEVKHTDYYHLDELNLHKKLNTLPTKIKAVIILHYFEQLTLQEISEITNTNLSTVKSRLYKGLSLLRLTFEKEGIYER